MEKLFISSLLLLFSLMMLFINHPLSMGFMILTQTLLISIISGMFIETYWFSYILFLTFMGGLLVLFIYVSSIASNEMFKIKNKTKFMYFILFLTIMSFFYFKNNIFWMNLISNLEIYNFNHMFLFDSKIFNLNKLYNNQTFLMMMILILYLFITLVTVVKITNIFYGPLRSNF